MDFGRWVSENWFELLQSFGIVGGFTLAAYTAWKDEQARRIGNSIAVSNQHRELWRTIYERSNVQRVLDREPDLEEHPVSLEEELFVTALVAHMSTVFRAMRFGEFVKLEGLRIDVRQFLSLPIPKAVWERLKPLQDVTLIEFVESCLLPDD